MTKNTNSADYFENLCVVMSAKLFVTPFMLLFSKIVTSFLKYLANGDESASSHKESWTLAK